MMDTSARSLAGISILLVQNGKSVRFLSNNMTLVMLLNTIYGQVRPC